MHPSIEAISKLLSMAVSAWQVPWTLSLFPLIPELPDPAWDLNHNAEICVMERKEVERAHIHVLSGETIVAVPAYSIQRDERYFVRPDEWIPERWYSKPELVIDRDAWIPFSVGPLNFAGKHFAVMGMKVLMAKAVVAFDIQVAEGEDDRSLIEGAKDFMTLLLPAFEVVFGTTKWRLVERK